MQICKLRWLNVEPAGHGGVLVGPPVIADGRPVQIDVSLRQSPTKALRLSHQADLSCDQNVDF